MSEFLTRVTKQTNRIDSKQTVVQVTRANKEKITNDDIRDIVNGLMSKVQKGSKVRVRGLGDDRWTLLKGLDDYLNLDDEEQYLKGTSSPDNFIKSFFQLEIMIERII